MKRIYCLFIAVMILLIAVGCEKQNLQLNINGAVYITVFSGNTGKSVTVTDSQAVTNITDDFNGIEFVKGGSSQGYDGFLYSIKWYNSYNQQIKAVTVMNESRISYNNSFYSVDKSNVFIDIDYIEKLFLKPIE